jgi:hypothetical protein
MKECHVSSASFQPLFTPRLKRRAPNVACLFQEIRPEAISRVLQALLLFVHESLVAVALAFQWAGAWGAVRNHGNLDGIIEGGETVCGG